MKKMSAALFTTAVVAVLGFPGTATAAEPSTETQQNFGDISIMAHPTGCTYGKYTNGSSAECKQSNGGSYKAVVRCRTSDNTIITREPELWRTSGISYVFCPPMTFYESSGIKTKSTS
ncbi:hypothetical protein [Streptomyces sp. YIM 98790]|uniref:hypothetical protein n=1 Tax=Streptomyces sp. YIM 98790 TaxID=2689077 RepID=UPI00140AA78D|nr:hypothetical protein [Streptomyces sp. YIM 98790]